MAYGLAQLFGALARRSKSPEEMTQPEFQQFLRRAFLRQEWKIESSLHCKIILRSSHTKFLVLPGQEFYMRDRVTIYPMFSFKVHELTKGPYKNRLIVVVVHDTAMLDIYAAEDYPAVCFLHWQNLHYLESLRDDVDFGDDMEASQRAWLLDAVTKSASLSRKRSIYETRAGNRKAAIEWAERAVGMDAENTNGYLLLARAYIADGQLGQAARTAAQALDCEANATSLLCKSEVEFRLGNHVAAVEWINRSIGKDPGNAYSYHHLAGLHELLGDQPAARAAAAKAVKLAPGNQAFAKRLASLTAG